MIDLYPDPSLEVNDMDLDYPGIHRPQVSLPTFFNEILANWQTPTRKTHPN